MISFCSNETNKIQYSGGWSVATIAHERLECLPLTKTPCITQQIQIRFSQLKELKWKHIIHLNLKMEWKYTAVSLPLLIELNFLNVFLQCRLTLLAFHKNIASKRSELHLNVGFELEEECTIWAGKTEILLCSLPWFGNCLLPLVNLGQDRW